MKSIVDLSQTEINQLLLTRIAELERRVAELELANRIIISGWPVEHEKRISKLEKQ